MSKEKQNEIIEQFGCFNLAFEDDYDLIEIRNKYHSKASGLKAILTRLEIETENTYFLVMDLMMWKFLIWWGILM